MPKIIIKPKSIKYISLNGNEVELEEVINTILRASDSLITTFYYTQPDFTVLDLILYFANKTGYMPILKHGPSWQGCGSVAVIWKHGKKKRQFFNDLVSYIVDLEIHAEQ